jgi:hypothetical protein
MNLLNIQAAIDAERQITKAYGTSYLKDCLRVIQEVSVTLSLP